MKPALAGILLALTSTLAFPSTTLPRQGSGQVGTSAQVPDPRDSVILESKTVAPGFHPGATPDTGAYFYLRVYITNKDTLTGLVLVLEESSASGGAYMIMAYPREPEGTISHLTTTLHHANLWYFAKYNGQSPDSFQIGGLAYPGYPNTWEPPNFVRKAFWEIKFDSVWNNPGTIAFDSAAIEMHCTLFINLARELSVNFVKSIISVVPKGDLNLDGVLSAADVMWILDCIYLGQPSTPAAYGCDLDCNGRRTAVDVVWELQAVFLGSPFPC